MKYLPLTLLILISLGLGGAYAHTFAHQTIFYSDAAGGIIALSLDFNADTYTVAGNQGRFTTLEMNANGSWTRLGIRNPVATSQLNLTHIGTDYLAFDALVFGATDFEVWLPDDGEPDHVTGAGGSVWADPTLTVTMNNNGTFILEWDAAAAPAAGGGGGGSLLLIIAILLLAVVVVGNR